MKTRLIVERYWDTTEHYLSLSELQLLDDRYGRASPDAMVILEESAMWYNIVLFQNDKNRGRSPFFANSNLG